jgi:hypothetical protein
MGLFDGFIDKDGTGVEAVLENLNKLSNNQK